MATETIQATDYKLYVAGEWIETGEWSEVKAPYDETLIARVPKGDAALVEKAASAAAAAKCSKCRRSVTSEADPTAERTVCNIP